MMDMVVDKYLLVDHTGQNCNLYMQSKQDIFINSATTSQSSSG